MWMAVGKESRKVYAEGDSRAEVMRKLQKKYPYKHGNYRSNLIVDKALYPEELRLVKIL